MYHSEIPVKVVDEFAKWRHKANVPKDDGGPVIFHWHWPRGTFESRMSALEIATFIMPHMPHIVGLFADQPRVQAQFHALLVRLATWPKEQLDMLAMWVKPVIHTQENDLVVLNLFGNEPQPVGPTYVIL